MDTYRPTFKLLLVVWGLFFFLHRSSAQRNAEEIIDIDGNVIPVHNVSGCYADFVMLTCTGSGIAPVGHIFTFRPPDVQENFNCLQCAGMESDCYHYCCTGNSSVDCRSDQQPTKDLKQRLEDCSHRSQCMQVIGRTSLSNIQECPNFLQSHGVQVYSQNEDIEYICIYQNWEVDVTQGESKSGAALFLKSRDRFYGENKLGFNLSCIVTSDEDTTIVIKSLDLRMCRSPCEQHLYFIEAAIMREVTLNETNSLGLGLLYQSTTNNLTLRLDSNPSGNLTLWLYVKPSNGHITVMCERPMFFTTTTSSPTKVTYLSPDGTQIEVHNVSGCYPDYFPSDLVCDGAGFITPVRNIFIFHLPDISSQPIYQTCVRYSQDCWYEDTPGKDLINYFLTCQHIQICTGNRFGQTYVTRDIQLDCPGFENRHNNIYSYFQVFEYMCIPDVWVVDMTVENTKTGAAVFLRKNYRFQVDNSQGYNISCTMTANNAGATIVIRSIDLRLCISNIKCDQVLRISDGTTRPFILNTYDEDQERWLGSPVIFESEYSTVTLTIDSGVGQVFSAWLYVSPSSGEVTVTCERPIYFTTTTTSSTTTVETTTSAAEVTTSHGHHDITCTESRMEFSIPLSSPHTSETATLSDPNCQINVTRTHVRGGVDLNSCGTTVQFQNDSVIFRNAIIFSAPESSSLGSSGSNSSVSQYQDIIPIQCVYNRIATVHLSYMPVVRRVLFTESGVGQFSFNIQQFWDASFTNMVSDRAYPLRMELDADVFIQLSVGSEGQPVAGHKEIGMEVQQCLVSPSSSVIEAQLHYYPLIQDGCPASSDVHIIPNTNASDSTVMRFRFRAVNFFDPSSSSTSSLVFVHCRMGLCLTGSCKPSAWSCLTPPARRVRRDVDQSKRAAHQLSTGPFLIMADEASTSSSSTTATVMAVVSTSVATVAIVIAAIALIALRRRRTTERN